MRISFLWSRGISFFRYSRKSCIRKSISVCGRRQFSTENAYSVSASIFNRAQVSMVVRADCVPERCPAILGRCRFWAQRPLPSMITATCLGIRDKSSLSRSWASSAVTGPSDSSVGLASVGWILVCDTSLPADGFSQKSLYAAKLTHAVGVAQRLRVLGNIWTGIRWLAAAAKTAPYR